MTGAWLNFSGNVSVFGGGARIAYTCMTGLRDFLVDDAIEILFCEKKIRDVIKIVQTTTALIYPRFEGKAVFK